MNQPEQEFLRSRKGWASIALASEGYMIWIELGVVLFTIAAPTEVAQIMELNHTWFADRYEQISAVGWWSNLILATATVLALGVLIHQFLDWLSGNARAALYAAAGAFALFVILITPWVVDATTTQGSDLGDGSRSVTDSAKFVASVMRSPIVVLMALVAALGVRLVQKGYRDRATHRSALAAIHSIDAALPIMDDALEAQQSRARRQEAYSRDLFRDFAAALSTQEKARMDALIGIAKGDIMAGEDFISELEAALGKCWEAFDPDIRKLARHASVQDIDLKLVADEVGSLSLSDRDRLVAHAARHKRRFSENRIRRALEA